MLCGCSTIEELVHLRVEDELLLLPKRTGKTTACITLPAYPEKDTRVPPIVKHAFHILKADAAIEQDGVNVIAPVKELLFR